MWKKAILAAVLTFTIVVGGAIAYLGLRKPEMVPASTEKVEPTPERLARGKHLFHLVSSCNDCHSKHEESRFGRPVIAGTDAAGAEMQLPGFPGRLIAPNLTPDQQTGLGSWTDGEIIRAIRDGVSRDGQTLFPVMPYTEYRYMSDEDVRSIVAYMRTLMPVSNRLPKSEINFPVFLFIKSVPQPAGSVSQPDRAKYGQYLARVAGCMSCHTNHDGAEPDAEKVLAGGRVFDSPTARVVSANISPDPDTGIGKWTEDQFLEKFYQYKPYVENGSPQVGPESFTVMPWLSFSQWPREDLAAVFAYLKTCKPIRNAVETHPAKS